MKSRSQAIAEIRNLSFDICVIGGGATGAGCALDAALRGLKTVLLEAGDFASATSSASTKLVHGGVRYLQQAVAHLDLGQYHVVSRALRERRLMLDNAPYLAHPLELLVPCFRAFDAGYFGIGMKIYDWIAGKDGLTRSHYLPAKETLASLPLLNPAGLHGSVLYSDGQFDDIRYDLALVNTFAEHGGSVANYARVCQFTHGDDGKLREAVVEDKLSGQRFTVRAKLFLNATGPFSDTLRQMANPQLPSRLRLSKGIHILLPLPEGMTRALLIPKTEDGRVIFAIPFQGKLLVGTTDDETTFEKELVVERQEVEYLLRHLNRYLRTPYTVEQVVSACAGLRPLVQHGGSRSSAKLIRDHEVEVDRRSGLISVLGGKWTTYRAMAEDAINVAQRALRTSGFSLGIQKSCTRQFPLAGAAGWEPDFWQTLVSKYEIAPATAQHLVSKFGVRAVEILESARADRKLMAPIVAGAPAIRAEIVYGIRKEMAASIEDVLARRIGLEWLGWNLAMQAAPVAGAYLAQEYDWSPEQVSQAVREYREKLAHKSATAGIVIDPESAERECVDSCAEAS